MGVKFFGQFLIEQGEVDAGQLRQALDLLDETNRSLGRIAVDEGLLTPEGAEEVNRAQRRTDKSFGDLAIAMKLMDHSALVTCLRIQRESRLMVGEALVHLGHVPSDRLPTLLDAFKSDQAPYAVGVLYQLPDPLANNRIAPCVLDLLPKFARRIADITIKVGEPQVFAELPPFRYRISLPIYSYRSLEIALLGDNAFSTRISAATSGLDECALDESLLRDGVGEFLNVLCGNAMSALDRDGVETRLGVPDYDAELTDGWLFDLATSRGRAALVLSHF